MITIVTGWSPSGWDDYAHRFASTFQKYWPEDVRCISFVEKVVEAPRIESINLDTIPGFVGFKSRWTESALARGRTVCANWKEKDRQKGYNWRFDAMKFCKQCFIPYAAMQIIDTEYLAWLDADVVTFRQVPVKKIIELLPRGRDVAYLGRGKKHSEIGFQLYRNTQATANMLKLWSDLYEADEIFTLKEWHSAFAFDHARVTSKIAGHDMTPGGDGHVWFQSPLGQWLDHLKGDRKKVGRSFERR